MSGNRNGSFVAPITIYSISHFVHLPLLPLHTRPISSHISRNLMSANQTLQHLCPEVEHPDNHGGRHGQFLSREAGLGSPLTTSFCSRAQQQFSASITAEVYAIYCALYKMRVTASSGRERRLSDYCECDRIRVSSSVSDLVNESHPMIQPCDSAPPWRVDCAFTW
jgi:hypothetical protein